MHERYFFKLILLLALARCATGFSQAAYQFDLSTSPQVCDKGSVSLNITGTEPNDTVTIAWSSGQVQVITINTLEAGDYSVTIDIKNKLDTTLSFTVEKEECPVIISRQFTPNGDGYNDELYINRIANYPNFELEIYNKWGQRVHAQKKEYVPWDGTWAGSRVPDGTYYFVFFFDADHKGKLIKGDITILR